MLSTEAWHRNKCTYFDNHRLGGLRTRGVSHDVVQVV